MVGYDAARPGWNGGATMALLIGTMLSAAGALALNQWRERDTDCMMERTRDRPLPSGALAPSLALAWSVILAVLGVGILAAGNNALAAVLSTSTIALYVFVYTPLKRVTRWATELGAIPGALPPLIGFAAADETISPLAWLVFALVALWQMPHFFAIGWVCRDDYREVGFPLLPAIDPTGRRTAAWSFGYCFALVVASLVPSIFGYTGAVFAVAALGSGGWMLWRAWQFVQAMRDGCSDHGHAAARRLFRSSLIYLPLVLVALVIDRCAW